LQMIFFYSFEIPFFRIVCFAKKKKILGLIFVKNFKAIYCEMYF
jgi:hypothetical protein